MFRFLIVLLLLVVPARAEMPAGHDDPRFQAAVDAWLEADEETSLPALAELARDGNTAAQTLLGRIDLLRAHPGEWLATLSHAERKVLFREPGGKFPRNWLAVAAETSALAAALQDARFQDLSRETLPKLISLGETKVALSVASRMSHHGQWSDLIRIIYGNTENEDLIAVALAAAFYSALSGDSDEARALRAAALDDLRTNAPLEYQALADPLSRSPQTDEQRTARARAIWAKSGHKGKQFRDIPIPDQFIDEVATSPAAVPLAGLCSLHCGESQRACYRDAHRMIGGLDELNKLGSPAQTLISHESYRAAPRAAEDALGAILDRVATHGMQYALGPPDDPGDQCLVDLIVERLE